VIRKIPEIMREKGRTFSFEIYPPKTAEATKDLYKEVDKLVALDPDYISVTYRAGGSSASSTLEIADEIQRRFGVTVMHHLTLVGQTRSELVDIIKRIKDAGIMNVLALRGDPTPGMGGKFRKVDGGLEYAYELIDLLKEVGKGYFSISTAGFPEGHIECPSKELDSQYLKIKLDHGAEIVVTQLFFDSAIYSEYLERTSSVGVRAPIVPGVLPITDYNKLLKFCDTCGAYICEDVHKAFKPVSQDLAATLERGIDYAVRQSKDLLARGAPGLHYYALNKAEPVMTIWRQVVEAARAQTVGNKA
jgi:methylenetetrahydrofolate reductase (NADPH)